nr:uncharacterized protein LOC112427955 [Macaca nemestrina]
MCDVILWNRHVIVPWTGATACGGLRMPRFACRLLLLPVAPSSPSPSSPSSVHFPIYCQKRETQAPGSVPRQFLGAAALRSFVSGHLVLHRPCRGSGATPPARCLTKPHRRLSSKFEAPSSEMPFEVRLRNSGQAIRGPGPRGRECFLEPTSTESVSWDRGAGLSLCIRTQGSAGTGSTAAPRTAAGQLWRLQSRVWPRPQPQARALPVSCVDS